MMTQLNSSKESILLIACGALAKEILELIKINSWDHLELVCLPAQLHLTPQKIPDAVRKAVISNKDRFSEIFVLYADCGTGGMLQKTCAKLRVEMLAGPHCYSFYDGNDRFSARGDEEMTSFYLTDFLVRQFDSFVWKPLGLNKHPELRNLYFGNYEQLVYLAQTNDEELDSLAESQARRLKLRYIRRFTGYGDLKTELAHLVGQSQAV